MLCTWQYLSIHVLIKHLRTRYNTYAILETPHLMTWPCFFSLSNFADIFFCFAQVKSNEIKNIMLNDHDAEVPDYLTGLQTRTQYRRPDWKPVFEGLKSKHVGQSKYWFLLYVPVSVRGVRALVCVGVCLYVLVCVRACAYVYLLRSSYPFLCFELLGESGIKEKL